MMKLTRKRFLAIPVVCVLAVMLVPALCYALFILFNHTAIYCSSKAKLTGLLKLDFADVEITEIQYKVSKGFLDNYTSIYVFLKEAGEWESKDFYTDCEDWYDQEPEYILSARIAELKKLGREDILVVAGGVIPAQDYDFLYKAGVAAIFGPGTPVTNAAITILELLLRD